MAQADFRPYDLWQKVTRIPFGNRLFGLLIKILVPYTGTIRPRIVSWQPGHAVLTMRDRWSVRNHLRCVHAIALANIGEAASGLAMMSRLPKGMRAILVGIDTVYLKKARGLLTAEGRCPAFESREATIDVVAEIKDSSGTVVCTCHAHWRVGEVRA